MDIKINREEGRVPVTVFHITGDLDGLSYEQLQAEVDQAIQSGAGYILLDLANVPFMSSAGIRVINQIFTSLRALPDGENETAMAKGLMDGTYKSRRLKLLNPSRQIIKTLSTAGIDLFLETYTDLQKAIASF
jgi:anti-anti-sigma regulatory factor